MKLQRLLVSMNDINQLPSLYDVLMRRYRSCKTVARVLKFGCYGVAWQLPIMKLQRLLVSMNDINQLPCLCDIQNGRYPSRILVAKVLDNGC